VGRVALPISAARGRLGLIGLLFALAGVGWWVTAVRMRGMDEGPGTALGTLGFFLGVWVVMMAAMMFPSVSPTVSLFARLHRARGGTAFFVGGYLAVWTAAGVVAYAVFELGRLLLGDALAFDRGGRWAAGAVLLAAAAWQVSPWKDMCLTKCRSPLGLLLGTWRDGLGGSFAMGAKAGAWCVGCCWALMASLFALGVMSLPWMAAVAGVIAAEKTLPSRVAVTRGVALLLVVLGVAVAAIPDRVPGLTVPGSSAMAMDRMGGSTTMDAMGR
jgi:predicted metal-binding membrane protein